MCVIGVQKNWMASFISNALDQCCCLANANERALSFGDTDQNRNVQLSRGGTHSFQDTEIGKIEMADGYSSFLGFRQRRRERLDSVTPGLAVPSAREPLRRLG